MADIGIVGLAVMGRSLALNLEDKGITCAVYNYETEDMRAFLEAEGQGKRFVGCETLEQLADTLCRPRKILMMIRAGEAVDQVIEGLTPFLEAGDMLIDGGNSYFEDTRRRARCLAAEGVHFIGMGVSGGEEGARWGPSLMPGGDKTAYVQMAPTLEAIAAKVDGVPCCAYMGPEDAGHYVKMVHNGIEYGDMQLIAETYFLMKQVLAMDAEAMAGVFAQWNTGPLDSYLVEITAEILKKKDPKTGGALVEMILDCAGQKGTGLWTSQQALAMGVAAPTIAEAVFARSLSMEKQTRQLAARMLPGPEEPAPEEKASMADDLEQALYAAKICSYAQGFHLLAKASDAFGWQLDLGRIALIWRGGCIIRARFLNDIAGAYEAGERPENLMLAPVFARALAKGQMALRRVVTTAARHGVPIPCLSSALSYYDAMRTGTLWANLIQAQRDFFGAHTYRRADIDGDFHTQWQEK